MSERSDCALRAAKAGAAVADGAFRGSIEIETKSGRTDVVTEVDRDAQRRVTETIRTSFPDETVVGEEDLGDGPESLPESGPTWVVDPIDGTSNFVRGIRSWCTSVAAVVDGEAVAGASVAPALGDTYAADADGAYRNGQRLAVSDRTDLDELTVIPTIWRGSDRHEEYLALCREIVDRFGDMRRFGSTQLALAAVASGAIDGVITNVRADPWDTIAGCHLVDRAGGTVSDVSGDPWRHDSHGLVASNGVAHEPLLEAVREAVVLER